MENIVGTVAMVDLEGENHPLYHFAPGKPVWPLDRLGQIHESNLGYIQNVGGINAYPVIDQKGRRQRIRGLAVWTTIEPIQLFNGRRNLKNWAMAPGSRFGALVRDATRTKAILPSK